MSYCDDTAVALERALGDPAEPANTFSFARSIGYDEAEQYPEDIGGALLGLGTHHHFVPATLGGRLRGVDELLAVGRVISRRDLTVAIAHGQTFLGAAPVWVSGDGAQQARLAATILHGGQGALALTEEAHGSDVLASEVVAEPGDGGFALTGRKWLINNGTRGRTLTIFARTDPRGGPRGFTLFLVERGSVDARQHRPLPKIRTHGIRGADISGVALDRCVVPAAAVVGGVGLGLEIALKTLQITRTLCAGFSLGAADTALRLATRFAGDRRLYGGTVLDLPPARAHLVDAFLDLLAADVIASTAARAVTVVPEQMTAWSAVVKFLVPTLAEAVVRKSALVLGARHYLREGYAAGTFQKLMRDNALIGLFDGSTAVNLQAIAQSSKVLFTDRHGAAPGAASLDERLELLCDRRRPVPPLTDARLEIAARSSDDLIAGLPEAVRRLRGAPGPLASLGDDAVAAVHGIATEMSAAWQSAGAAAARSVELFELAERFTYAHGAAACLHVAARQPMADDAAAALAAAIDRLLIQACPGRQPRHRLDRDRIGRYLVELVERDRSLSLHPYPIAARGSIQELS